MEIEINTEIDESQNIIKFGDVVEIKTGYSGIAQYYIACNDCRSNGIRFFLLEDGHLFSDRYLKINHTEEEIKEYLGDTFTYIKKVNAKVVIQ